MPQCLVVDVVMNLNILSHHIAAKPLDTCTSSHDMCKQCQVQRVKTSMGHYAQNRAKSKVLYSEEGSIAETSVR